MALSTVDENRKTFVELQRSVETRGWSIVDHADDRRTSVYLAMSFWRRQAPSATCWKSGSA